MHTRELDPRFGVLAEWGKLLPVPFWRGIIICDVRHGESVPHVGYGESEVATVALHPAIVVPASQENAAAAG